MAQYRHDKERSRKFFRTQLGLRESEFGEMAASEGENAAATLETPEGSGLDLFGKEEAIPASDSAELQEAKQNL